MKSEKIEKLAFVAMGVTAFVAVGNALLMANGIETMPNMWAKEVYQDPMLGASIGGMTGIGLGGVAGALYIGTSETVKAGVSLLREKFTKNESNETKNPKLN